MNTPVVNIATSNEREKAVATLVLAFSTDPMARWSMPNADVFLAHFPDVVRAFAGNAFEAGTVHYVADCSGVAIWLAPGSESDQDAMVNVLQKAMPESLFNEGGALFEQMEAFHPHEPHWYLPLIGVDPAQQGKKYGSHLMEYALKECDRTGTPAYLESSNPTNIPFYEQYGFEVAGKIQSGSSPVMYPMVRKPCV